MSITEYINTKQELYNVLLSFLEYEEDEDMKTKLMIFFYDNIKEEDNAEMKFFLQLINKISENHHRTAFFLERIISIIQLFSNDIKLSLSNQEIFDIFKENKLILYYLFKNKIIEIDQNILNYIQKQDSYKYYFHSEIECFLTPEEQTNIKLKLSYNDSFDEMCKLGENDTYICSLIRNDLIIEFISYVNRNNISFTSRIKQSIFETNSFLLINNEITLIEYAAFYGSTQIFNFLRFNNVEMSPKLWLYAIHSKNPEMIHLLEENQVKPEIEDCLIESIKCHHNDFAEYILNNLMPSMNTLYDNEKIVSVIFDSYNYNYFPNDYNTDHLFFNLCKYKYSKIVNLFFESDGNTACLNKTAFYYKKLKKSSSTNKPFSYYICSLDYIVIPPSINCISDESFMNLSSLNEVLIPNSVTKIGIRAFSMCKSLKQITIPDSVTIIDDDAFFLCSSLTEISIPNSVTKIGRSAFHGCSSLRQISLPDSITEIREGVFNGCKSLTQITNLSSVKKVNDYAFIFCSSLTHISIPNLKEIGDFAFLNCSSLVTISVLSSISEIGRDAFKGCSSLKKRQVSNTFKALWILVIFLLSCISLNFFNENY